MATTPSKRSFRTGSLCSPDSATRQRPSSLQSGRKDLKASYRKRPTTRHLCLARVEERGDEVPRPCGTQGVRAER